MTSILFGIVKICSSILKCNYLKNKKDFLNFMFHWWNLHQILNIFQKKMIVIAYLFSKLKTVKTWVDQSVKSVVSEHRLAVNILKGSKHLWNLRESVFIIFFDHSERKWLGKYLPYWTLKSWRCLLTHWLPMRSIPLGILGICRSLFKCKYLKNEKLFLNLLFHWWNLHQILNIFGKKIIVRVNVFPN